MIETCHTRSYNLQNYAKMGKIVSPSLGNHLGEGEL